MFLYALILLLFVSFPDFSCNPDPVFGGDDGGGMFISYPEVSAASATVDIKTWVKNFTAVALDVTVRWTILDANVTNFLTALVLYEFGSGPIKGFAVTLSIGIMASMFTALVVTREIYRWAYRKRTITKLSI